MVFDIDDTIVDFTGAARSALLDAVHRHLGPGIDEATIGAAWFEVNEAEYTRYTSGELSFEQMRLERMRAFLGALGRPAEQPAVYQLLESARHQRIFQYYRLFDDVLPVLDRLSSAALTVAALSNSDGDYQRRKLATVGLQGRFASEIFSGDLGIAKPDPRIFRAAIAQLGVPPAAAVYVGDRWESDILGARGAGLRAVWIDRGYPQGRVDGRGARDDPGIRRITGLDQLDAVLAGWGKPLPGGLGAASGGL